MLKRKIEVNYRKAFVKVDGHHRNCKGCAHMKVIANGVGWRCDVIGWNNARTYTVAADHICDAFES